MSKFSDWWNRVESVELDHAMRMGWKSRIRAMLARRLFYLNLVTFMVLLVYVGVLYDIGHAAAAKQATWVAVGYAVFILGMRFGVVLCEENER